MIMWPIDGYLGIIHAGSLNPINKIMKKTLFLTLVFSLFAFSCEDNYQKYFDVINNSNKALYIGRSFSYPDTSLKNIRNGKGPIDKSSLGARQTYKVSGFNRNPTLQVFIFDSNVIENTPWDTVVKYNMFLKRYQFTEAELEKMNYEIIYDGN